MKTRGRPGRVNALIVLFVGGVAVVALAALLLKTGGPGQSDDGDHVILYCAAGMRVPIDKLAAEYEEKYGVRVEVQYNGSNALLVQLQADKFSNADLYLAGDDFYTQKAKDLGLAVEQLPIGYMRPVIAVSKENAKDIKSIQDLLREDVRVVIGNPDAAAVGRAVRKRLQKFETDDGTLWSQLEANVVENGVMKPTVNEVATDIKLGAVDAGIIWDSTVAMPKFREYLTAIPVEQLDGDPNLVTIAVLSSTEQPTTALKFARYITARDRGLPVFEKYGFRPVDGDIWVENPEITFFCGAINREAVETTIDDFQQREGVTVNTIVDGCGILTGRMQSMEDQTPESGFPDFYMACDRYYLDNVEDWFQDAVEVSDAEIVIVVPKGSTEVTSLADLIKPGIRVSIGEPDQCTIGALTRRLLSREGLYEKLMAKQKQDGEVVVQKSSSALLVPDVTTGHVDATIAYVTDTIENRNDVDVIQIDSPLKLAVQPLSISKSSPHKYLVRRLFDRIAESKERFESAGFHFRLEPKSNGESEANPGSESGTNADDENESNQNPPEDKAGSPPESSDAEAAAGSKDP